MQDNGRQVKPSAHSLITSSKKRKDLLVISENAVLVATRKSLKNNQEKSIM